MVVQLIWFETLVCEQHVIHALNDVQNMFTLIEVGTFSLREVLFAGESSFSLSESVCHSCFWMLF